jgi:hypothetical protein
VPFSGFEGYPLSTESYKTEETSALGNFILQAGGPDYFRTMGTRIVRGRGFLPTDRADAPPIVIVSEGMARTLWPGRDPLGQCLFIHERAGQPPCRTVVGLAEETEMQEFNDPREHTYYLPLAQHPEATGSLLVRVAGRGEDFAEAVRHGLTPLMRGDDYATAVPLSETLAGPRRSWQLGATMFVAFGLLALVVAAVGLYSVVAYGVAQRTGEIAIRLALGATKPNVLGLVLAGGLAPVLVSLAIGGGVALAAGRWLAPLLFQVSPRDPVVYGGVAGALLVVAVIALCVPARAATRVDPNRVLRAD